MHLRGLVKTVKDALPWQPKAEDLVEENVDIPDDLYNLLVWIIGGDTGKDAIDGGRVQATPTVH